MKHVLIALDVKTNLSIMEFVLKVTALLPHPFRLEAYPMPNVTPSVDVPIPRSVVVVVSSQTTREYYLY